uniref:Uncharacterized protein n=1 Tax=Ciona savignyi TaxID=51511 RepID=H2YHZ6_CIOSA
FLYFLINILVRIFSLGGRTREQCDRIPLVGSKHGRISLVGIKHGRIHLVGIKHGRISLVGIKHGRIHLVGIKHGFHRERSVPGLQISHRSFNVFVHRQLWVNFVHWRGVVDLLQRLISCRVKFVFLRYLLSHLWFPAMLPWDWWNCLDSRPIRCARWCTPMFHWLIQTDQWR